MEPVALQHAVVERGVGVLVVGERLVVRDEGLGAVGLDAARREDRAIAGVGRLHLLAGRQRDGRERGVGGGERVVAVVGGVAGLRRQRQQPLPRRVEDVLLLPVEILDREPVHRERLGLLHPHVHGRQRYREQLGVEPRRRLAPLRQQVLDALAAAVGGVVALVLVVVEGGEVVDAIGQLAEGIAILERRRGATPHPRPACRAGRPASGCRLRARRSRLPSPARWRRCRRASTCRRRRARDVPWASPWSARRKRSSHRDTLAPFARQGRSST